MPTPESIPLRALGAMENAQATLRRAGYEREADELAFDTLAVNEWNDWIDEIVYALKNGFRLPQPPSPTHERKRVNRDRRVIDLDTYRRERVAS